MSSRNKRIRPVHALTEYPKLHHLDSATDYPDGVQRPRTRGECDGVERPCPFISCRYNLYLEVTPKTGGIKFNFPDIGPDEMPEHGSCALDAADDGEATLEVIAQLLNITRQAVEQTENRVIRKLRSAKDVIAIGTFDERTHGDPCAYADADTCESRIPAGVLNDEPPLADICDEAFCDRVYAMYERRLRSRMPESAVRLVGEF